MSSGSMYRAAFAGFLLSAACTSAETPAGEEPAAPQAAKAAASQEGRPVTEQEVAEMRNHPAYRDLLAVLADNGSSVDLAAGNLYAYEGDRGEVEILLHPVNAEGTPDREYSEVTYQRIAGIKSAFALVPHGSEGAEALTADPLAQPGCTAEEASGFEPSGKDGEGDLETAGCTAWSSWALTHTACEPRFWCFAKNQQGTYSYWQRSRVCNWGTQIGTRRRFVGCGC